MTSDQDVIKRNQEMLIFQTVLVKPPTPGFLSLKRKIKGEAQSAGEHLGPYISAGACSGLSIRNPSLIIL